MNLGCKVNAFEAEAVAQKLEEEGYERVPVSEPSDVALIFTCAVTNTAAQKSRQMLHRIKRLNPNAIVAVAGCYAQIDAEALRDAEIVVGSYQKKQIPQYLKQYLNTKERIVEINQPQTPAFEDLTTRRFENKTRAYLKIQDGCNQFCTYCVIPYARGRERSLAPDGVIEEAKRIAKSHKEIVLTGIHTGRYGKEYGITLDDLVDRLLNEVKDLQRLRFSSIEVTEITDRFIETLAKEPRIAKHLHIPLQSGSDTVLKRMHRPYDTAMYTAVLNKIRTQVPEISISCDLIVGFPQETVEEFEETLSFLKQCEFSFIHVFPYSARNGTPAAKMPFQIDSATKKERVKVVQNLSQELYDSYKSKWIGKVMEVNVERVENGFSYGHASEYTEIAIPEECPRGIIIPVKVQALKEHMLYGDVV